MALEHGQVVINLCDDEDEVPLQRKSAPAHIGQPSTKQRLKESASRKPTEIVDLSASPERDVSSRARRRDFRSSPQASDNTNQPGPRKRKFETSPFRNSAKSSPAPRTMTDTAPGPDALKSQKRSREIADFPSDSRRPDKRQRSVHLPGKNSQETTKGSIPSFNSKAFNRPDGKSPTASRRGGADEIVDLTEDAEVATSIAPDRVAGPGGPVTNGRRRWPAHDDQDVRAADRASSPRKSRLTGASLDVTQHEAEELSTSRPLAKATSSPMRKKISRPVAVQKDRSEGNTVDERGLEIPESPLGTPDNDRTAGKHGASGVGTPGATSILQDPAPFFKATPKAVARLASASSPGPVPWGSNRNLPLTPSESSADEEARNKAGTEKQHNRKGSHRLDTNSAESASRRSTPAAAAKESTQSKRASKVAEKVQDTSSTDRPTTKMTKTLGIPRASQAAEAPSNLQQAQKNPGAGSELNTTKVTSSAPVPPAMSSAKQIERVMGHCLDELQRDNEHWTRMELQRARFAPEGRHVVNPEEPTSVFSKMRPLTVLQNDRKRSDKTYAKFESESAPARKKSAWLTPYTTFNTDEEDVPPYSHFVKLKHNFLAPNETTLQHWPYFDDETNSRPQFGDQFKPLYKMDMLPRPSKLLLMMKAENFAEQAEHMLQEVHCDWADVLHFLLDASPDVGNNLEAEHALLSRDTSGDVRSFRESKRWAAVRDQLPKAVPAKIASVALLCEQFHKLAGFSFWHVARRSDYTRSLLEGKAQSHDLDELTCRVCMRLSCPYHGEIEDPDENSDSEGDSNSAEHSDVETDIINPKRKNFRTRVGLPAALEADTATGKDRRHLHYWQSGQNAALFTKADERFPFYPCHHPGQSCSGVQCSCHKNKVPCEKSCACSDACTRKFQGCNCAKKGKVCFNADNCACFQLGRECDPDLCGNCGVCDVLDPVHSHDDRVLVDRCRNANIQRGHPKHTMLGRSTVHGLGLYACEPIREHEFIGEYKGEVITTKESERRGAVYEHQKLSYLFTLNKSQEVDSTFFGNKMRYINHATKAKCNVYARIIMVNTVHRISLFAGRDINPGDELFFDYGPTFFIPGGQDGGSKGGRTKDSSQSKAVPHVRNANLTKSFYDPDLEGDERGARAAQKSHGRPHRADEGRLGAAQIRRMWSSSSDVEMADPDDDDEDYQEADVDDEDDELYR